MKRKAESDENIESFTSKKKSFMPLQNVLSNVGKAVVQTVRTYGNQLTAPLIAAILRGNVEHAGTKYKTCKWWGCFPKTSERHVLDEVGSLLNKTILVSQSKLLALSPNFERVYFPSEVAEVNDETETSGETMLVEELQQRSNNSNDGTNLAGDQLANAGGDGDIVMSMPAQIIPGKTTPTKTNNNSRAAPNSNTGSPLQSLASKLQKFRKPTTSDAISVATIPNNSIINSENNNRVVAVVTTPRSPNTLSSSLESPLHDDQKNSLSTRNDLTETNIFEENFDIEEFILKPSLSIEPNYLVKEPRMDLFLATEEKVAQVSNSAIEVTTSSPFPAFQLPVESPTAVSPVKPSAQSTPTAKSTSNRSQISSNNNNSTPHSPSRSLAAQTPLHVKLARFKSTRADSDQPLFAVRSASPAMTPSNSQSNLTNATPPKLSIAQVGTVEEISEPRTNNYNNANPPKFGDRQSEISNPCNDASKSATDTPSNSISPSIAPTASIAPPNSTSVNPVSSFSSPNFNRQPPVYSPPKAKNEANPLPARRLSLTDKLQSLLQQQRNQREQQPQPSDPTQAIETPSSVSSLNNSLQDNPKSLPPLPSAQQLNDRQEQLEHLRVRQEKQLALKQQQIERQRLLQQQEQLARRQASSQHSANSQHSSSRCNSQSSVASQPASLQASPQKTIPSLPTSPHSPRALLKQEPSASSQEGVSLTTLPPSLPRTPTKRIKPEQTVVRQPAKKNRIEKRDSQQRQSDEMEIEAKSSNSPRVEQQQAMHVETLSIENEVKEETIMMVIDSEEDCSQDLIGEIDPPLLVVGESAEAKLAREREEQARKRLALEEEEKRVLAQRAKDEKAKTSWASLLNGKQSQSSTQSGAKGSRGKANARSSASTQTKGRDMIGLSALASSNSGLTASAISTQPMSFSSSPDPISGFSQGGTRSKHSKPISNLNDSTAFFSVNQRGQARQRAGSQLEDDVGDASSTQSDKPIKGTLNPLLSNQQRAVINLALAGKSFFFTGAAGTGKSFVMREIVNVLKDKLGSQNVFVCASTGAAACNIGGCTLHSFAGIGLGDGERSALLGKVMRQGLAKSRWLRAKAIIVDEVSMLDPKFFDDIEWIAREVRRTKTPNAAFQAFGGIQIILCGDFFQLPPVKNSSFLFQCQCWDKVIGPNSYELKKIYRQEQDPRFIDILNEIRLGELSQKSLTELKKCINKQLSSVNDIKPTSLYSTKAQVEKENNFHFSQLPKEEKEFSFKATDYEVIPHQIDQLDKSCPARKEISLKIGAQVILLKNLSVEDELVNGARGKIIGFQCLDDGVTEYPVVQFAQRRKIITPEKWSVTIGDKEVASREQIPLDFAWALSIHKAQGMTIDKLVVTIDNTFAAGQAYVALSRATSLEGLSIKGAVSQKSIFAASEVIEFYTHIQILEEG